MYPCAFLWVYVCRLNRKMLLPLLWMLHTYTSLKGKFWVLHYTPYSHTGYCYLIKCCTMHRHTYTQIRQTIQLKNQDTNKRRRFSDERWNDDDYCKQLIHARDFSRAKILFRKAIRVNRVYIWLHEKQFYKTVSFSFRFTLSLLLSNR